MPNGSLKKEKSKKFLKQLKVKTYQNKLDTAKVALRQMLMENN